MNIKGLLGPTVMPQVRPTEKVDRTIRSDSTHDRDANGQQARGDDQQEKKGPMSEEQMQKALDHLRNLPAVKEHKWTIELCAIENKKFVLIKDNLGNVIRKIPEIELWSLPIDEAPKGNLLQRTA